MKLPQNDTAGPASIYLFRIEGRGIPRTHDHRVTRFRSYRADPAWIAERYLGRGPALGVIVTITDRQNGAETALRAGDSVTGSVGTGERNT